MGLKSAVSEDILSCEAFLFLLDALEADFSVELFESE